MFCCSMAVWQRIDRDCMQGNHHNKGSSKFCLYRRHICIILCVVIIYITIIINWSVDWKTWLDDKAKAQVLIWSEMHFNLKCAYFTRNARISLWNAQNRSFPVKSVGIGDWRQSKKTYEIRAFHPFQFRISSKDPFQVWYFSGCHFSNVCVANFVHFVTKFCDVTKISAIISKNI